MKPRLQSLRKRAKEKKIPFDLDKKWMSKKLDLKNCEVSNIQFDHDNGVWHTPSIDRVDNDMGYIKDNCKAIIWGINVGKGQSLSYDDLYKISKLFVEKFERIINEKT